MDIVNITHRYFKLFSEQDIDSLSKMFADNISLRDWSSSAVGKSEVLDVIKGIYKEIKHITINVTSLVSSDCTVMAEIAINADGDILEAVDVIEYESGKIKTIRAYKQ